MIGIDDAAPGSDGESIDYPEVFKPDPNDNQTIAGVVVAGDTPPYDDEQPQAIIALAEATEAVRVYDGDADDNVGFADLEVGDGLSMSSHAGLGFVNRAEIGQAVIIESKGSHDVEWAPSTAYIFDTRVMDRETWDNDSYEYADAFRAAEQAYTGPTDDRRPLEHADGGDGETGGPADKESLSSLASDDDDVSMGSEPDDSLSPGAEAAVMYVTEHNGGECDRDALRMWVNEMADDPDFEAVLDEAGLEAEDNVVRAP
jgi:hypothetical protein